MPHSTTSRSSAGRSEVVSRSFLIVLVTITAAGSAFAFYAGADVGAALLGATIAIVAAAVAGISVLSGQVRRPARPNIPTPSDSFVPLREAFRTGRLGRQAVIATLRSLERDMLGPAGRLLPFDQEQQLLLLTPKEFREWAVARMRILEAST